MSYFKNKPFHEKILITLGIAILSLFAIVHIDKLFSLDDAVINNDATRVKLLLLMGYVANPKDQQTFWFAPLETAVVRGNKKIAEILILHGADINIKGEHDLTLLDVAIMTNKNDMAKFLIEKGIQLNEQNLDWAVRNGNKEIAELLINKGLDVNAPYTLKFNRSCHCCPTPLVVAASKNQSEVAQMLFEHGANINGNEKNCYTPLHAAAEHRAEKTVKLLLGKGADVNAEDGEGHTPLYYATENEDITVQQILITAGAIRK